MATTELATFLSQEIKGPFEPKTFYEKATDSLIFYWNDTRTYGRRINKYFTVFLSIEDDSLAGIEIKGVKVISKATEDMGLVKVAGPLSVTDENGDWYDLSILIRQSLVPHHEEPIQSEWHDELDRETEGVSISKRELCGVS